MMTDQRKENVLTFAMVHPRMTCPRKKNRKDVVAKMVARAVVGLVMKKPKKLMKKPKTMNSNKYLPNTKQSGEALELLSYLEDGSVSLVFLDPQYEVVNKVLHLDYPLYAQSDYQVLRIMEQVSRVLKPSGFALLWVNKTLLGNDRVPL
jgi:hypothetical protein